MVILQVILHLVASMIVGVLAAAATFGLAVAGFVLFFIACLAAGEQAAVAAGMVGFYLVLPAVGLLSSGMGTAATGAYLLVAFSFLLIRDT